MIFAVSASQELEFDEATRARMRREDRIAIVGFIGLFLGLPLIIFQIIYVFNFFAAQSFPVSGLEEKCFLKERVKSGRTSESFFRYMRCDEANAELTANRYRLEGRRVYTGSGRAALVTIDAIVGKEKVRREFHVTGVAYDQATSKGIVKIRKLEWIQQDIEIVENWTYVFTPLFAVWLLIDSMLPMLIGYALIFLVIYLIPKAKALLSTWRKNGKS